MHGRNAQTLTRMAGVLLVLAVGATIAVFGAPVPSLAAASVVAAALNAIQGRASPASTRDLLGLAEDLVRDARQLPEEPS